jgi:hypothetical protein
MHSKTCELVVVPKVMMMMMMMMIMMHVFSIRLALAC